MWWRGGGGAPPRGTKTVGILGIAGKYGLLVIDRLPRPDRPRLHTPAAPPAAPAGASGARGQRPRSGCPVGKGPSSGRRTLVRRFRTRRRVAPPSLGPRARGGPSPRAMSAASPP